MQEYMFSESLVADALHHYTMTHCYGKLDEEFYYELCVKTFFNNALEICIVLDYLEEVYRDYMLATPLIKNIMRRQESGNSSK